MSVRVGRLELRRKVRRTRERHVPTGYLFILPQVLGFLAFGLSPILANIVLTFFKWNILTLPAFVGFRNFVAVVENKVLWMALLNTATYSDEYVIPCLIVSLTPAVLLNQRVRGMETGATPSSTGEDGVRSLEMVMGIYESQLKGNALVRFPLPRRDSALYRLPVSRSFDQFASARGG